MHAKHLYIPHLAGPLSAKGCTGCMLGARRVAWRIAQEDCSKGLLSMVLRRIAQRVLRMMLRVVLKWFAHWVSYSAYAGLKCWVHGKWVGSRLAQRCVGGQSSHNMARIAGYCAGIGALEWAREGRLRVPGALRGALCALLATWCVLVKDDMAWVICAACCRGAHSRFEREASVGCRGLRCVWCVCGARASSRRRGLKRWGRVCGRHATHKYTCLCGGLRLPWYAKFGRPHIAIDRGIGEEGRG